MCRIYNCALWRSKGVEEPYRDVGVLFLHVLFILSRFWSCVSAEARSRDQLCGWGRLSQVLQVIVVVIKKHSELVLFLPPLLHLHLQEQMPTSVTRSGVIFECYDCVTLQNLFGVFVVPWQRAGGHVEVLSRLQRADLSDFCAPGGRTQRSSYRWRSSSFCEAGDRQITTIIRQHTNLSYSLTAGSF